LRANRDGQDVKEVKVLPKFDKVIDLAIDNFENRLYWIVDHKMDNKWTSEKKETKKK
jgi:hypothetical protein